MDAIGERDVGLAVWALFGLLIAAVVGAALFEFLGTVLFAVFLYYATRWLERRLEARLGRPGLAATLTLLAVVVPLLLVLGYATVVALRELDRFLATNALGGYRAYLQPYLSLVRAGRLPRLWELLVTSPGQPLPQPVRRALGPVLGQVTTVLGLVVAVLTRLFLGTVLLFYLLSDDRELAAWFRESVGHDERVVAFTSNVDDDLETVFFGNLAIVVVSGAVATLTYLGLNVVAPGGVVVAIPTLLGLLTGIATLVPIIGMKLVYVPYAAYLAALALLTPTPAWHPIAFFLLTLVVVDTIPDFFIRSYLSARGSVRMGMVLLGYVLGTMAFGWAGLFLGPLAVVFAVHFGRSIFPVLMEHVRFS